MNCDVCFLHHFKSINAGFVHKYQICWNYTRYVFNKNSVAMSVCGLVPTRVHAKVLYVTMLKYYMY